MNCVEHPNIAAVSSCGVCGAGLCKDCETNSAFRIENKPLCKKCNQQRASDFVANSQSLLRYQKKILVVWLSILGLGIIASIAFSITQSLNHGIIAGLLIWGFANIGTMLKQSDNRSVKSQVKTAIWESKNPLAAFIGNVLGFILGYALCAISLPIQIIIILFRMKKNKKIHEDNINILNKLS
jgi:hypothetical protein